MKFFFSYFFKLFTSFDKFDINFYLLSNSGLTASFVSRYIVRQLRFGHDIKDILGTLRVEFRQVRSRSKEKFSLHYIDKLYSKLSIKSLNKKYSFNSLLLIYFILLLVSVDTILNLYPLGWYWILYSFIAGFIPAVLR